MKKEAKIRISILSILMLSMVGFVFGAAYTIPSQGGNTGTWGTDLNNWLSIGINLTDGNVYNFTDASIRTADIANLNITSGLIANWNVTALQIAVGGVNTTNILDATILNADIADGTIANAKLASNAVNLSQIQDWNVNATKIGFDQVNASHLNGVNKLLFGVCNVNLPSVGAGGISDTISNAGGNCTISGASIGDVVMLTPQSNGNAFLQNNITVAAANISINSVLTITFSNYGDNTVDLGVVPFGYMVFVNGSG